MKKFGFTLAEVLITLGIVGVVAALTAPALVVSSRNASNAARLSVTVSNLENALTTMIMQENADTLFQTRAWGQVGNRAAFAGNIARYLNTNGFKDQTPNQYYADYTAPSTLDASGAKSEAGSAELLGLMQRDPGFGTGTNHIIELKNGAVIFVTPCLNQNPTNAEREAIINSGGSLFNQAAAIFIDVNGSDSPNTIGRDIFYFYLGENGILYPVGGRDASIFDQGASTWEVACPINGNITWNGYACTGRVISEGYKITY